MRNLIIFVLLFAAVEIKARACESEGDSVAAALVAMVAEEEAKPTSNLLSTRPNDSSEAVAAALVAMVAEEEAKPTAMLLSVNATDEWQQFGNHVGSFLSRLADNKSRREFCLEAEKLMLKYELN